MTQKEQDFTDKVEQLAKESEIELREWKDVAAGSDVFNGWNVINFREAK